MKIVFFLVCVLFLIFLGCKKEESDTSDAKDNITSNNALVLGNEIKNNNLIAVDSTKLTFISNSSEVDKIKIGTILVSDMSDIAPNGFLRKVTGISITGNNKVFTTEQASLTDAIVKGSVKFRKAFTDNDIIRIEGQENTKSAKIQQGLSFNFHYDQVLYDNDGNNSTTYDQIHIIGEMQMSPTLDFELDIDGSKVNKFNITLTLNNTNKIAAESKIAIASLKKEIVLQTFYLQPFTIPVAGIPIPIASQWIAIVLGIDGNISARVVTGAQNITSATAGVSYENGNWNNISNVTNSLSVQPLTFEGSAKLEPWLQARYEIRPYGIKESRIYIGVRGSVIGEASVIPSGLSILLNWGVRFSGKAQIQVFDKAVLDYEKIFFEKEFPIYQATSYAFPSITTWAIDNITSTSALCGGNVTSDGGTPVTARGVCWDTSPRPTVANNKTIDGTGTGTFTSSLTGLISNTTYYIRAYATNNQGTSYGEEVSFKTIKPTNNFTIYSGIYKGTYSYNTTVPANADNQSYNRHGSSDLSLTLTIDETGKIITHSFLEYTTVISLGQDAMAGKYWQQPISSGIITTDGSLNWEVEMKNTYQNHNFNENCYGKINGNTMILNIKRNGPYYNYTSTPWVGQYVGDFTENGTATLVKQ